MGQKGKGPGGSGRLLAPPLVNEVFVPKTRDRGLLKPFRNHRSRWSPGRLPPHRHPAIARSEAFHLFHGLGTGDDILIHNGQSLFTLGLPGLERIGSGLLAEDDNLLGHLSTSSG